MKRVHIITSRSRLLLLSIALAALVSQPAWALRPFGNTCGGTLTGDFIGRCQLHNGWSAYLRYISTTASCLQMCCKVSSDGSAVCVNDPDFIRDHKSKPAFDIFYFSPVPETRTNSAHPDDEFDGADEPTPENDRR